jgi:hypothetical protein
MIDNEIRILYNCTMKFKAIPFLALFLLALSAQAPQGTIGWYNGDWQSGIPSHPNWHMSSDEYARVYDQFQVPAGGWTVVSVFSNVYISDAKATTTVSWEIRRSMAPGNGGELVASGMSPAIQVPDPAVAAPRYRDEVAKTRFRIQANFLHVQLAPGTYWVSVAPSGLKTAFASPTLGANGIGIDANGPRPALLDMSTGSRFAIAESMGHTGQVGRARFFSQGVIIARQ